MVKRGNLLHGWNYVKGEWSPEAPNTKMQTSILLIVVGSASPE